MKYLSLLIPLLCACNSEHNLPATPLHEEAEFGSITALYSGGAYIKMLDSNGNEKLYFGRGVTITPVQIDTAPYRMVPPASAPTTAPPPPPPPPADTIKYGRPPRLQDYVK